MNKFKVNYDVLEAQVHEFTKGGTVLGNVFSISAQHPWLSLLFLLSFGLLTNSLFDLMSYVGTSTEVQQKNVMYLTLLSVAFVSICLLIFLWLKYLHKDLFSQTPLDEKKALITLVSKDKNDFKKSTAYNTYKSLLYNDADQPTINTLQKVILITSESPQVLATAEELKSFIEMSNRTVEIFGITITNKSPLEIQQQIEVLFNKLKAEFKPHEMIADYTGGTKDMSIALFKVSEKEMVVPVYLNEATTGNYSIHQ